MSKEAITPEQLDGLRELAEALTNKKYGNVKDPMKLQAIIDVARMEQEEKDNKDALSNPVTKSQRRAAKRKKATKLVRVNITAMSPFEKQLKGAYFDVGNSLIGAVRRYVPFDVDWHVEQIIVNHIKAKTYRSKREIKDPTTRKTVYENVFSKAFGVTELDNLSPEQLAEHTRGMKAREYNFS